MPTKNIRLVAEPVESAIAAWFPGAYLLDTYSATMAGAHSESMLSITQLIFRTQPAWMRALMMIRDVAVSPFGIRTSAQREKEMPSAEGYGFFYVMDESPNEIVLGADDRHLDFRLSIMRRATGTDTELLITTAVQVNNWLGRIYIQTIRPFHHLLVQRTLLRVVRLLSTSRVA